jgi:DNA-binding transcriptional MerR regulator
MNILKAKAELESHRERTDIKMGELVGIANRLIKLMVPKQPSGRVAEKLNERTLRYYISEGLVDRPLDKEGTAALYRYRHLLQALIVKSLQREFQLKEIKEILRGKDEWELESILAGQPLEKPVGDRVIPPLDAMLAEFQGMDVYSARQKVLEYLNYLKRFSKPPDHSDEINAMPPSPHQDIKSVAYDGSHSFRPGPSYKEMPASNSWERFSLEDGIELNVRSDRVKELRSSEIRRILEMLINLLKTRK